MKKSTRVSSLQKTAMALAVLGTFGSSLQSAVVFAGTSSSTQSSNSVSAPKPSSEQHPVSFSLSFTQSANVGASVPVTVTAEDVNGHVVTGYTGTVQLSSSDSEAVLPEDYNFQPTDKGTHTFWVTLNQTGPQSVTIQDVTHKNLVGSFHINVLPALFEMPHTIHMAINSQDWIDPTAFTYQTSMRVPIYHVQYVLRKLGISNTWDGLNLRVMTPPWLPVKKPVAVIGSGAGSIYLNGILVAHFDPIVETRYDGPPPTTYAEFENVFQSLDLIGVGSDWTQWDKQWNWHVPLAIQGKQTAYDGQTDPLSLTWTTGNTVGTIPNSLVKWQVSGQGAVIDSSGNFMATTPGTYTVTAWYAGLPSQMQIRVEPQVNHLLISAATPTIIANGVATDDITVTALDEKNQPVPQADLTMALKPSTLAKLNAMTGITNQTGQAHFILTAGTIPGLVNILATGGGATASTNVGLFVPAPPPAPKPIPDKIISVGFPTQNYSDPSYNYGQYTFKFQVLDKNGKPVPDAQVDFSSDDSKALFNPQNGITDANGYITLKYGPSACNNFTVTATIHGTNIFVSVPVMMPC